MPKSLLSRFHDDSSPEETMFGGLTYDMQCEILAKMFSEGAEWAYELDAFSEEEKADFAAHHARYTRLCEIAFGPTANDLAEMAIEANHRDHLFDEEPECIYDMMTCDEQDEWNNFHIVPERFL